LGELIPTATTSQNGLMPSVQRWYTNNENTYTGDLNDIKRESRVIVNKSTTNNPIREWAICETIYIKSDLLIQKVYEYFSASVIYVRAYSYNNIAWSNWTKIVG
ncbi:MAG: hypothetical protein ROM03_09970, partial [Mucispirillum sp.]|nr:hypothetical protein [Mucispirillum sp.]